MSTFSPKLYFFSLLALFSVTLGALIYALTHINPDQAGFLGFLLFYSSLFLFCLAFFTLLGYSLRVYASRNAPLNTYARISLRQGVFLAIFFVAILLLQGMRSVSILTVGMLIISISLLEMAFLTK